MLVKIFDNWVCLSEVYFLTFPLTLNFVMTRSLKLDEASDPYWQFFPQIWAAIQTVAWNFLHIKACVKNSTQLSDSYPGFVEKFPQFANKATIC